MTRGLQQRREEAEERLDEAEVQRPTGPFGGAYRDALSEVVHEHAAQAFGEGAVVDEGVDLEVVLEAAKVEVGRSDAGQFVVREQQFGVEEACAIEVHLYAGAEHVV